MLSSLFYLNIEKLVYLKTAYLQGNLSLGGFTFRRHVACFLAVNTNTASDVCYTSSESRLKRDGSNRYCSRSGINYLFFIVLIYQIVADFRKHTYSRNLRDNTYLSW